MTTITTPPTLTPTPGDVPDKYGSNPPEFDLALHNWFAWWATRTPQEQAMAAWMHTTALAMQAMQFNRKGDWVTDMPYSQDTRDWVQSGGSGYVCVVSHTAGTFATDLAAGKWVALDLLTHIADAQPTIDSAKPMQSYTALRAYTGSATGVRITTPGISGPAYRDDSDTTTADNGITVFVDALGRRWKRLYSGFVNLKWAGAIGNGVANDSAAVQIACNYCNASGETLFVPAGRYLLVTPVDPKAIKIVGESKESSTFVTAGPTNNSDTAPKNCFLYNPSEVPSTYRGVLHLKSIGFEGPGATSTGMRSDSSLDAFCRINYYTEFIVEDCKFTYSKGPGIRSGRCNSVVYKNNDVFFCHRDGMMAWGANYVLITGNLIKYCDDDGISATSETYEFDNSGATAVNKAIIIADNILESTKGIRALGAVNTTIHDNILIRPLEHAIWACGRVGSLIEGRNDSLNVSIRGNKITDVIRGDVVAAAGGANSSSGNFGIVVGAVTATVGTVSPVPAAVPGGFDYTANAFVKPEGYWYRGNTQNDVPRGGSWFIDVKDNQVLKALPNTALYSDYGYGQVWTGMGWVDPVMTDHMMTGDGIAVYGDTGSFHDLSIDKNTVYGWEDLISIRRADIISRLEISRNNLVRFKKCGISFLNFGTVSLGYRIPCGKVSGNTIDGDPYLEHALRNSDGTWNTSSDYHYGIDNASVQGLEVSRNTFRNVQSVLGNPGNLSNLTWLDNVYVCQPTGVAATNKGIRNYVDYVNSRFSVEDSDPTSSTYLAHISDQGAMISDAVPTAGFYHQHQIVKNSAMAELGTAGSKYVIFGWRRRSTGVSHSPEADHWQQVRMLTGT